MSTVQTLARWFDANRVRPAGSCTCTPGEGPWVTELQEPIEEDS